MEEINVIRVIGLVSASEFQRAKFIARHLSNYLQDKSPLVEIKEMFQLDWLEYLEKERRRIGGKMWIVKHVAVFCSDKLIGNDVDFYNQAIQICFFLLPVETHYYEKLIKTSFRALMKKSKRTFVYLDISIDDREAGSLIFMLYSDLLPYTCHNFLELCRGTCTHEETGVRLHYANSRVHRIVKDGWIQCGDIEFLEGGGGIAANSRTFPDESYCIPHNRRGVLSMANNGKHTNASQFTVCLKANPWMNYHYVAFGQLVDGAKTLQRIEEIPTFYEKPSKKIVITSCGSAHECIDFLESKILKRMKEREDYKSLRGEEEGMVDYGKGYYCYDFYSDDYSGSFIPGTCLLQCGDKLCVPSSNNELIQCKCVKCVETCSSDSMSGEEGTERTQDSGDCGI